MVPDPADEATRGDDLPAQYAFITTLAVRLLEAENASAGSAKYFAAYHRMEIAKAELTRAVDRLPRKVVARMLRGTV